MRSLSAFLALVLSVASLAAAQTGRFVTPSGADFKTTYHTGQKVNLEWTGTAGYDLLSLGYYAPDQNNTITWLISNSKNYPTSYEWVIRPGIDGFTKWETQSFALLVVNGTNFGQPFLSPMFYIQKKDEPTTAPTSTPTGKPTVPVPSGANLPTTTSTVGEGNATVSDGAQQEGLSTGAKAGIGAGVGVGALVLIAALAFFFLAKRRRNGYDAPDGQEARGYHPPQEKGYMPTPVEAPARAELPTQAQRFEMAA